MPGRHPLSASWNVIIKTPSSKDFAFAISSEKASKKRSKISATAFLQHPENAALREKVSSRQLTAVQFHRQLLLLVYRLLFLMVAEERGLIVSGGENAEQNQTSTTSGIA